MLARKKLTVKERKACADFMREVRREMPFATLKGEWTLREWNTSLRSTAYNLMENQRRFRAANE